MRLSLALLYGYDKPITKNTRAGKTIFSLFF